MTSPAVPVPPAPRRGALHPTVGFLGGAALLLLLSAGLAAVLAERPFAAVLDQPPWWFTAAFVAAMVLGESTPLRLGVRHEMLRVTVSTIPFVVAVLLLPPVIVIIGYAIGALVGGGLIRRTPWPVTTLNTALAVFEGLFFFVGLALWGADLAPGDTLVAIQPRLLPISVTMIVLTVISALCVSAIHRAVGLHEPLLATLGQSIVLVTVLTGLAFIGFTVWFAVPSGSALCIVLLLIAVVLYRNYLDNHQLVHRLRHDAYHDVVTGAANRLGVARRAEEARTAGRYGGVLFIDLNMLGLVTGALGNNHGDELLIATADRLRAASGDRVVGRLSADRFVILLEPMTETAARQFAERLLAEIDRPIMLAAVEVEPAAAAGISLVDNAATGHATVDHEVIARQAQMALTAARSRDETLAVYRPSIGEGYQRRFQLASQFRAAVDDGSIFLHYQPKVSLITGELDGVEALVRWKHPDYGFVPPVDLIAAIEQTTAIDLLFDHVLDLALGQVVRWARSGWYIPVAVNMSVRNLLAPGLIPTVTDALRRHDLPADLLCLEITESSVMAQPDRSVAALAALDDLGVRLSLDDFGTGYSSLAYLRRLPVNELKIDRSFVQGMVTDVGDLTIVRAIIDLGRSLGLRIVAEGVEEDSGREVLRSMGCDVIQGYLLARPMPPDRLDNWLAEQQFSRISR